MKKMYYRPVWAAMLLLCLSVCAQGQKIRFEIYIADDAYAPTGHTNTGYTFADAGVAAIAANYNITLFRRAHSVTKHDFLKKYWLVEANSLNVMADLMNYKPYVFMDAQQVGIPQQLYTYNPNDYGKATGGKQFPLDRINARAAWNVDTGNASTVIGIMDSYFDTANADLKNKFAKIRRDVYDTLIPHPNHGSAVAGCAAGATNNDTLLASICPNCMLDVANAPAGDFILDTIAAMAYDGRRILSVSYQTSCDAAPLSETMQYDEMYEYGTLVVCAASNGNSDPSLGCPSSHLAFPASESYNISVTGVGSDATPGATYDSAKIHAKISGVDSLTQQHNVRVDICAPSWSVNILTSGSVNGGYWWEYADGTSFAAPMVAGACGLMLSHNSALSPYQMKYILKRTADTSLYFLAANYPYYGLLGRGILDAGAAMTYINSKLFTVNDPATQAMDIVGVDINTLCIPGQSSNGVKPQLKAMIINGTPPFTYKWNYIRPTNQAYLDNQTSPTPTIDTALGTYLADFYLEVTDNTPNCPKRAARHIRIQLNAIQKYDLTVRDSYLDMMDEPNTQAKVDFQRWNVWESPDVWNRVHYDGDTNNQNPVYFGDTSSHKPNFAYAKVRNVGCQPSPAAKLHLYWTKASTGEKWKGDWDTATYNGWSAGHEITDTGGIFIPNINPGYGLIFGNAWYPPRPQNYDTSLSTVEVCLLARIVDGHNPSDPSGQGMTYTEVPHITTNVINNNNIATRNTVVSNPNNIAPRVKGQVLFANTDDVTEQYNLDIATDKHFFRFYSGDITKILKNVVLTLSPTLFTKWFDSGAQGNYTSMNPALHTVTFSPTSDFMQLKRIYLTHGEKETVNLQLQMQDTFPKTVPINLHVVQEQVWTPDSTTIYGDVDYVLVTDTTLYGHKNAPAQVNPVEPLKHQFGAYPNPTTGSFTLAARNYQSEATVMVIDVLGRAVYTASHNFSTSPNMELNIAALPAGIYHVKIMGKDGYTEALKIVKQ